MMAFHVPWLVDAARMAVAGTGKQVIVSPGWQTRGQGGLRVLEVVVGHHTGTPETAPGDYPSLKVVRDGRTGLVGLLSQLGLGRSGNVYVIGSGIAYHAGASAYQGFIDLNDESIGIEAEDSGDGRWTADQLFIYPRLVRACLDYMRRGVDRYASHRTVAVPAGRKNDPAGITDQWMRQQAAAVNWQQENDMDANDPQFQALAWKVEAIVYNRTTVPGGPPGVIGTENKLATALAAMNGKVDGLFEAVRQLANDETLDLAAVKAAAKAGTAEALAEGTVDVDVDIAVGGNPTTT